LLEEITHALQQRGFGVGKIATSRETYRIAREVALIEQLARAKGAADDIPGQTKELDTLGSWRLGTLKIALNVSPSGALQVTLARGHPSLARR
jgi:hypothetical protein